MLENIYETGKVIVLRKVITVNPLAGGRGVEVGDSDLHGEEVTMELSKVSCW